MAILPSKRQFPYLKKVLNYCFALDKLSVFLFKLQVLFLEFTLLLRKCVSFLHLLVMLFWSTTTAATTTTIQQQQQQQQYR